MRYYVGLSHSIHDPALAIVDEAGAVVFAEATERPLQNKRAWHAPPDLLHYVPEVLKAWCEPEAEIVLCTTWSRTMWAFVALHYLMGPLRPASLYSARDDGANQLRQRIAWLFDGLLGTTLSTGLNLQFVLRERFGQRRVRVHRFDHHRTHAAAALCMAPCDEALCLVVDGFGELGSLALFQYRDGQLTQLQRSYAYASIGFYYHALTEWCGFDAYKGEEWKVMGLAPYGKRDAEIEALLRTMVPVRGCDIATASTRDFNAAMAAMAPKKRRAGAPILDAANLAFTGQAVFCDVMSELLRNVHALGLSDNLCLGGGCALNSAYNGLIVEQTPFRNVYVPSAPGDDGNAVGAALLGWQADHPGVPLPRTPSPYLGSKLDPGGIERYAEYGGARSVRHLPGTIHQEVARLLAQGKIVGWARGRAEFGPRALGNRSILADPRSAEMKDRINARVKLREAYRPFAPSLPVEAGPDWFESYQESPYMERTLRWRPEVRDRVPAVVHEDGTGRLQTVRPDDNPVFYGLLKAFEAETGVPVLLNTSFNVMGKPIMHSVEDAVAVFATSGLDVLVLDDHLFEK
jgi:carbamoyltransferase